NAAKLHGQYEELLRAMRPSRPYLDLLQAMFTTCWEAQAKHIEDTAKAYAAKAKQIEGEIAKVVDRMLDVANPRALKAFEGRIEQLEQEKFVALEKAAKKPAPVRPFSEMFELSLRFLTSPYDCWKSGRPEVQKLVLKLTLNKPLRYDRKTGCLNLEKPMIFKVLEDFQESEMSVLRDR
ncbi:hypothetical protein, partial [Hyphomonas atlantica]|uniref:hypothetical protein n=1 Tax=Hyphomonas atlantica TaxID=1280948 RepID=UPI0032B1F0B8